MNFSEEDKLKHFYIHSKNTKKNKISNRWENAMAAYSHLKEDKKAKTIICKKTRNIYFKETIVQQIGNTSNSELCIFYIDAREYN